MLKSPYGHVVYELNPDFKPPTRPFRRMNYSDAIEYLKKNNITKDDGSFYEFGEVCIFYLKNYTGRPKSLYYVKKFEENCLNFYYIILVTDVEKNFQLNFTIILVTDCCFVLFYFFP